MERHMHIEGPGKTFMGPFLMGCGSYIAVTIVLASIQSTSSSELDKTTLTTWLRRDAPVAGVTMASPS